MLSLVVSLALESLAWGEGRGCCSELDLLFPTPVHDASPAPRRLTTHRGAPDVTCRGALVTQCTSLEPPPVFALVARPSLSVEDRVAAAYAECLPALKLRSKALGITWPPKKIYLRAFKDEKVLEVWVGKPSGSYVLWEKYEVAAASGELGPKRVVGDLQVPEGLYHVAVFNPQSRFHLSLGLNYPNKADKILGNKENPGSDIYVHGSRASIGCLAMTDKKIKPIYVLACEARRSGQKVIPVHIFPSRLTKTRQAALSADYPEHARLWAELGPIFRAFEKTKLVPAFQISEDGRYILKKS